MDDQTVTVTITVPGAHVAATAEIWSEEDDPRCLETYELTPGVTTIVVEFDQQVRVSSALVE